MNNKDPLGDLDEWEEFLQQRYPEAASPDSGEHMYRDYRAEARPSVKEFYRLNHRYQTRDFVKAKKAEYLGLNHRKMGIWEAMEYLNTLVDDSDPDTDLTQIEHLLQTSEAIRADGHPRWFILTGLIHDLGKILCLWGEPQWAVVGDTVSGRLPVQR
jgi:inositol oxygenase